MPSNLTTSGYSSMTWSGVANSMGGAIQSAPGNTPFMQGMKWGYAGGEAIFGPILAFRAAKRQKAILNMKAEAQDLETQSLQTAADDAMKAGHAQSAAISFQAGQAKSAKRASTGASGVQVNDGSSARVLASYDISKEVMVNQTMANAVAASMGQRRQAAYSESNALAYRSAAAAISPWAAAITTHLTSAMDMLGGGGSGGSGGSFDFSSIASMFGGNKAAQMGQVSQGSSSSLVLTGGGSGGSGGLNVPELNFAK